MDIALIPARAGSKRLPGKNVAELAGKPMWKWSLDAAIASACFDEIWVSTDCDEIIEECEASHPYYRHESGAWVHERSAFDAGGDQTTEALIRIWHNHIHRSWDTLALLQPTSPCRSAHTIRMAMSMLDGMDSLISVGPGTVVSTRTNGALYCVRRTYWERTHALSGGKMEVLFMSAAESVDVDTAEDFTVAEKLLVARNNPKEKSIA
jgi:CMP-N-acetylneuraminic acid synthetase